MAEKIKDIRVGTIGSGMIVGKILDSVMQTRGITCQAVYSRSPEKAGELAATYHAAGVYTELKQLWADEEVNFIYIASPNSLHYEQCREALLHGKHVICEKPFAADAKQAAELISLAREKELWLLEGITTTYLTNFGVIRDNLKKLGRIRLVSAVYGQYSSRYDALLEGELPNVFNPAFAGGALMDINLYNVYLMVALFGKPESVRYFANRHPNGIDTSGIVVLQYPDFLCQCMGAKDSDAVNSVQILGEKGSIYVEGGSNGCKRVLLNRKQDTCVLAEEAPKNQWKQEVQGWVELIQSGDYAECIRRMEQTLAVVETLEAARKDAGIRFPSDEERQR